MIDSESRGDPAFHVALEELVRGLAILPAAPRVRGTLTKIVRRGEGGLRESPDRVLLTPLGGVPGDTWGRTTPDELDAQIAVMQTPVAELIAGGQPLELFGDSLFLDFDLSTPHLPIGSRVRIGASLLEVTPKPHNGCRKFHTRFGNDALRFVSQSDRRHLNLRGIYLRVIEAGDVRSGDGIEVVNR